MISTNTIRTVATRAVSRRAMSDAAGPKMHKAKDAWKALESTRPPEGHPHNVFEPPYSSVTVGALIISVIGIGYGSMYMGMRHQQYKAGYWK